MKQYKICDYLYLSEKYFWSNSDKKLVTSNKLRAGVVYIPAFASSKPDIENQLVSGFDVVMYVKNGYIVIGQSDCRIRVFDTRNKVIRDHYMSNVGITGTDYSTDLYYHIVFDNRRYDGMANYIAGKSKFILSKNLTGLFTYTGRYTPKEMFRRIRGYYDTISVGMSNRKYVFLQNFVKLFEGYALHLEHWGIAFDFDYNIAFIYTWTSSFVRDRVSYILVVNIMSNYSPLIYKNKMIGEVVDL